jgi:hypothetical protein
VSYPFLLRSTYILLSTAPFLVTSTTSRYFEAVVIYSGDDSKVKRSFRNAGLNPNRLGFVVDVSGYLNYGNSLPRTAPGLFQGVSNYYITAWNGAFAPNRTATPMKLPPGGPYQIAFRALKHFGKVSSIGRKVNYYYLNFDLMLVFNFLLQI